MLVGVRKKRKADAPAVPDSNTVDAPTMLGEGLVRKKAKADTATPLFETSTANGVNTLGAGLVRKKQKS
jgi:regulator of Ty1 transposition protein 109